MAWQLIYTSAPRLLQAGRSGFGTLARHRDIPPLVVEMAERCSQFSRQDGLDPARRIHCHRIIRSGSARFHLLTCITDAGTDYSGRTNHLARHWILSEAEVWELQAGGATPAGTLLAAEESGPYQGEAGWLGEEACWTPAQKPAAPGAPYWQRATDEAGRARVLLAPEASAGALLEYPAHYQTDQHPWILWLFAESQSLCADHGWDLTFTTNLQPTDDPADFRWIAIPEDSPVRARAESLGRFLCNFHSPVPEETPSPAATWTEDSTLPTAWATPGVESAHPRLWENKKSGPVRIRPQPARSPLRPVAWGAVALGVLVAAVAAFLLYGFLRPKDPRSVPPANAAATTPRPEPKTLGFAATPAPVEQDPEKPAAKPQQALGRKIQTNAQGTVTQVSTNQSVHPEESAAPLQRADAASTPPPKLVVLFPGDLEDFQWPVEKPENLELQMVLTDGTRQKLVRKSYLGATQDWLDPQKTIIFQAPTVSDKWPMEPKSPDHRRFIASGSGKRGEEIWMVVLSKKLPVPSTLSKDDPLQNLTWKIAEGSGGFFLRTDTNTISTPDFFAAFDSFERRARADEKRDPAQFRLRGNDPKLTSIAEDARAVGLVQNSNPGAALAEFEIVVDQYGRLDLTPVAQRISRFVADLERMKSSNMQAEAQRELQSLAETLEERAKEFAKKLNPEAQDKKEGEVTEDQPQVVPSEIYTGVVNDPKTFNAQVKSLLGFYFSRLEQVEDRSPEKPQGSQASDSYGDYVNKALQAAGQGNFQRAASAVVNASDARKKGHGDDKKLKAVDYFKGWAKELQKLQPPTSRELKDDQRQQLTELHKQAKLVFAGLLPAQGSPLSPPDLSYDLEARRGASGPWFKVATGIKVVPRPGPTPTSQP